jgi:hypothetical protein
MMIHQKTLRLSEGCGLNQFTHLRVLRVREGPMV